MSPKKKKSRNLRKTPKALLREKLYVPCEFVTDKHLKAWTYLVPDPEKTDEEDKIELQLYKDLGRVYAFCSGDLAKIRKHFSPPNFNLIDKRAAPKMDHPISMTSTLYTPETDPHGAARNQQEVADGWIKYGYGQIQAPARFGKCAAAGTAVKTPTGSVAIEALRVGDTVYGYNRDGSIAPCEVVNVFDSGVKHNVVDLVHNNTHIVMSCTLDHVMVSYHRDAPNKTYRETKVKDLLTSYRPTLAEVYEPIPGGIKEVQEAYALGALLGDGCCTQKQGTVFLSSERKSVVTAVANSLKANYVSSHKCNFTWSINREKYHVGFKHEIPFYDEWLDGKKAHEKTCNLEEIRTWTRDSQLAFLAGLWDTDGSVHLSKDKRLILQLQIQAKPVLDVVADLLMDLFQVPVTWGLDNRDKYVHGPIHMLIIGNTKFSKRILRELPTVLPRKQWKKHYEDLKHREPENSISVKGSDPYSAHCYDIHVDNDTNLYVLANGTITHNTITISDIVCRLGVKALILSHQWDILDQFERTIREHTDIETTERMVGRKLVSRLDKWDWDRLGELEIVLSSWQAWWHPSKRHYLKKYRDQFGIVLVDESHLSSPPCYSKVVNGFNSKYRCGNTATPSKLSELHVVIENIVGPVVVQGHSKQMKCIVEYVHTDVEVEKFPRGRWSIMINRLVKNKARNKLIVDMALADAKNGRHILITTDRVAHAQELAASINVAGVTAIAVTGDTTERDALWDKARRGEVQVVVAMRRITRLGIDIPIWDTFYNILPTSDPYNYYQELSRIRTPYEGKPTPIIKDFIDDPERETRGAIIGTMTKRNQVYIEQGFEVKNAAFKPKKPKRLSWGRRTRKNED